MNKSHIEISPINELADIETRDKVYRDFLNMLKLKVGHRKELEKMGFLISDIEEKMYRTIPKDNILRRLTANKLKRKYDLSGIPGFYQNEDWVWNFTAPRGFFIPVFDEEKRIQALSIHLDNEFNGSKDIWFSSKSKINGTAIKNIVVKRNITKDTAGGKCDGSKVCICDWRRGVGPGKRNYGGFIGAPFKIERSKSHRTKA